MNKTLLFLFVVLSLVSFAASQACNATNSCAGKGKTCVGDSSNPNNCDIKNGTCCAKGLLCYGNSTKTCTNNNIGDSCTSSNQCIGDGSNVACIKSICQYVYGPGESCSTNTDCLLQLCTNSTSKCGLAVGSSCSAANAVQCAGGSYCGLISNGSLQCVPYVTNGNPCNLTSQCNPIAHYCNGTGTGSVCMPKYSVGSGGSCSAANGGANACAGGLYCNASNICVSDSSSLTSCTATANCTAPGGGICVCNPYTGNQFCGGPGYSYNPCDSATKSLAQCLDSNNCQYASGAPDSCCKASCSSEYKKAQSCGCDGITSLLGGCGYNSNCGGFPVWAIIVIIVVAIVLVLAIVLLVFFMMRRRRQYDSI